MVGDSIEDESYAPCQTPKQYGWRKTCLHHVIEVVEKCNLMMRSQDDIRTLLLLPLSHSISK